MKRNHKKTKKNNHFIEHKYTKEDEAFLYSNDARGIRLQLDYLKAEVKLKEHGVDHTIVVFGSARITEFDTAMKELERIKKKFKKKPASNKLLMQLKEAERIVEKSRYYEEARKFGQLVGNSGKGPDDCQVTLMTGGGPGIMEAANRGAFEVGAKSIGMNIELPREQKPNPYLTPELSFHFRYFALRKLHFIQRAKALVVFPGGFGTLDELFDILTLMQTEKTELIPVILVCPTFWKRTIDFEYLQEEGVISKEDLSLFIYVNNGQEAWDAILKWHEKHKTALFSPSHFSYP